ncbi:MAG: HNH endonuclease, partial [Bacteroidales bacterium]|nr:HNH endonuclease [Candidatus Latescibacterota bacterium]
REKRREARAVKAAKVKKVKPAAEAVAKADRATKVRSVVEVAKVKPTTKVERVAKAPTKADPNSIAPAKDPEQPSRFIPQAVKDEIFRRDGNRCAYRSPDGRRCDSKWNLQVDHIIPFALGGSNSPENLQLLCRRHNQYKALKDFGKKKMCCNSGKK